MLIIVAVLATLPAVAQDETMLEEPEDLAEESPLLVPEATPVPVSIPVPAASSTPLPGPGSVLLSDNFEDLSRPNFPLSTTGSERSQGYVDGQYEMINGNTESQGISVQVPGTFSDTSIVLDMRVFGGPASAGGEVSCRRGVSQGYRLTVRPVQQRIRLFRFDPIGQATLLDQPAAAIRAGDAWNRVELGCVGQTITVTINGTQEGSVQDRTYSSGRLDFGLVGSGATARFDNLVVTQR